MAQYEVTGPLLVRGRRKGESFSHRYTPEQEAALVAAGHIRRKPRKPARKPGAPQPPSGQAAQSPHKKEQ